MRDWTIRGRLLGHCQLDEMKCRGLQRVIKGFDGFFGARVLTLPCRYLQPAIDL
jgi:hypothetical protein